MNRKVLRADGRVETLEVGDGFRTWNKAINAGTGTIVQGTAAGKVVELWCDDEALCCNAPVQNIVATMIARQPIFGDVIVFAVGDIK
jgi:hypothetical protein